jgi:hypothetical protein
MSALSLVALKGPYEYHKSKYTNLLLTLEYEKGNNTNDRIRNAAAVIFESLNNYIDVINGTYDVTNEDVNKTIFSDIVRGRYYVFTIDLSLQKMLVPVNLILHQYQDIKSSFFKIRNAERQIAHIILNHIS